jgi:hypothetical protein
MFCQHYTVVWDRLVMLGGVSFLGVGLVNVYGIGSTVKQGLHLHETLGISYWGDFYGQSCVAIAE